MTIEIITLINNTSFRLDYDNNQTILTQEQRQDVLNQIGINQNHTNKIKSIEVFQTPPQTSLQQSLQPLELVQNPGFETGTTMPASWTTYVNLTSPTWIYPSTPGNNNTGRAIGIQYPTSPAPQNHSFAALMQYVNIDRTKTYHLSGYIKTDTLTAVSTPASDTGARIMCDWRDASNNTLGTQEIMTPIYGTATPWTIHELDVTVPSNLTTAVKANIVCMLVDCTGTAYFDDISFQEVTTGTTSSTSSSSSSSSSSTGTTSSGTTSSGTTSSGTTSSGTTQSGTTSSGTTQSGTTSSGTTQSGTTSSGTTQSGTTSPPSGTVKPAEKDNTVAYLAIAGLGLVAIYYLTKKPTSTKPPTSTPATTTPYQSTYQQPTYQQPTYQQPTYVYQQ